MMADSAMSVGQLTSFLMYAVYVTISVGGMTSFYSELIRGIGASSRLWQLVDRQPKIPLKGKFAESHFLPHLFDFKMVCSLAGGCYPSTRVEGDVGLENVTFSYPSRPDYSVLRNLNLTVKSGSALAVVGSSGSGKSTIASLLLRYYDPSAGKAFV